MSAYTLVVIVNGHCSILGVYRSLNEAAVSAMDAMSECDYNAGEVYVPEMEFTPSTIEEPEAFVPIWKGWVSQHGDYSFRIEEHPLP